MPDFAALPFKPCRHPSCPNLVRGGGYCRLHQKAHTAPRGESENRHSLYSGAEWKKLRAYQLMREPYCRECARHGITKRAEDVDHIIPHRGDLRLFRDTENLQSLCHSCHSRKTIAEQRTLPPPKNV